MNYQNTFLAVYDDNCPFCTQLKELGLKLKIIEKDKVAAYSSLPIVYKSRIDPEHFKFEMALLNLKNGTVNYGWQGVRQILSSALPGLKWLWMARVLQPLFIVLYRLLAYNRYFWLKSQKITCSCEPKVPTRYTVAMWGLSWLVWGSVWWIISLPWVFLLKSNLIFLAPLFTVVGFTLSLAIFQGRRIGSALSGKLVRASFITVSKIIVGIRAVPRTLLYLLVIALIVFGYTQTGTKGLYVGYALLAVLTTTFIYESFLTSDGSKHPGL